MRGARLTAGAVLVSFFVFGDGGLRAQLPLEPRQDSGQGVTAAYEGWFKNADGSFSLLIGYFNRNLRQTLDIPAGPNNRIEPGGPDQGQPTHFMPRRQWGVFTIRVPADFGDRKLTWTIVANKYTTSVAMGLHPDYQVEPLRDAAEGNTPPIVRLEPGGRTFQGPPMGIALAQTTAVGRSLTLILWVTDDGKVNSGQRATDTPITVSWSKYSNGELLGKQYIDYDGYDYNCFSEVASLCQTGKGWVYIEGFSR